MNKKGFTLTELMAVLILLSIVTVISVTSVLTARDKANSSIDKNTELLICNEAKRYLSDNGSNSTCINVETLVDEDYLKDPIVNDSAKNEELMKRSVHITIENDEKKYSLEAGKCA